VVLAVDRLPDERGAGGAVADDRDEHVLRHPGFVQHLRDVQPGQCREFGRLVEHRVPGDERRHEDIAADEIRIVPRRDVGDHAERHMRDPLVELLLRISVDPLFTQRVQRLCKEEIEPTEQPVQLIPRLSDRLADLGCERARKRFMQRDDPLAKLRDRLEALADRNGGPPGLGSACRTVLRAYGAGVVRSDFGDWSAGGGIGDLHRVFRLRAR